MREQYREEQSAIIRATAIHVAGALKSIPFEKNDEKKLDAVEAYMRENPDIDFFTTLSELSIDPTPGLWTFFIGNIIHEWSESAKDYAAMLDALREIYPETPRDFKELLDRAAKALGALAMMEYRAEEKSAEVARTLTRLAEAVEEVGDDALAYDLANFGLLLGPSDGPCREQTVRICLGLALTGGKAKQISACSTALAEAIVLAADQDHSRELEAFDACELALEHLSIESEDSPTRKMCAVALLNTMRERDYLESLQLGLMLIAIPDEKRKEVEEQLGFDSWPPRCRVGENAHRDTVQTIPQIVPWLIDVEEQRLRLERPITRRAYRANWVDWTIEHPAYKHAVPHNRSFLREYDFDTNIFTLAHEVTHVLCLAGSLGTVLSSFRVCLHSAEVDLWPHSDMAEDHELSLEYFVTNPIAPLSTNRCSALYHAERALLVAKKLRLLQDIWTPLLEGVAILAELAVDPLLDEESVTPVIECLRNLIDVYPTHDNKESFMEDFEKMIAEFDQRYHEALESGAESRLEQYFATPSHEPYFAGYLVVRAILSRWHMTMGKPIAPQRSFQALLHATRYDAGNAIPDLSLPIEEFENALKRYHLNWLVDLANLDKESLVLLCEPPTRNSRTLPLTWRNGKVVTVEEEDESLEAQRAADIEKLRYEQIRDALPPESNSAIAEDTEAWHCRKLIKEIMQSDPDKRLSVRLMWKSRAEILATQGLFLPIGTSNSRFFISKEPDSQSAMLHLLLRTAERRVGTDGPSVNSMSFTIDMGDAEAIVEHYEKTSEQRMKVTRIIDLTGYSIGQVVPFPHLYALEYGDWFFVMGTTPPVDTMIRRDENRFQHLQEVLRQRMQPNDFSIAEAQHVYPGREGARRTLEWLAAVDEWFAGDLSVDVRVWADYVESLAREELNDNVRIGRRQDFAVDMLNEIWGDAELAKKLGRDGFENATAAISMHQAPLVHAIFKSGQFQNDQESEELFSIALDTGLSIFEELPHGWDIRPVKRTQH